MSSKPGPRAENQVKVVPGTRERSARVIRLKEELNLILELVVHSRESLQNELSSEFAQRKLSIDRPFLSKLKELTACYNSLTASRIQLDKAETKLERELTPSEEKAAVFDFVFSLDSNERTKFIKRMIRRHTEMAGPRGTPPDWNLAARAAEAEFDEQPEDGPE